MSKYTTEVRFYCEHLAGYTESQDYDKIDSIVQAAAPKIFSNFPMYDESYRLTLECKILKHYYTREICAETPALWKLWLNNRMNEIMPYYNLMYKSAMLEFNPFYDVDLTREHEGSGTHDRAYESAGDLGGKTILNESNTGKTDSTTDSDSSSETEATATSETNSQNTRHDGTVDAYSDTPQGPVQNPVGNYMTNARDIQQDGRDTGSADSSSEESSTSSGKTKTTVSGDTEGSHDATTTVSQDQSQHGTDNINTTDKYLEHVYGKQGTQSYSSMLLEYRETLMNIDLMIIEALGDLFFNLY